MLDLAISRLRPIGTVASGRGDRFTTAERPFEISDDLIAAD